MGQATISKDEIKNFITTSLSESLKASGISIPTIGSRTRPFQDIAGFDSHMAIDTCLNIEEKINYQFKEGHEVFLFFDKEKKQNMTVDETAEFIFQSLN